ncbi:phage holin family protein [Paenibacillus sp. 2RAB27]|uniref:phage holin family protein n=1 Tax=Paenibacillus sp. 2RAB27 TaxID=3232991 RepID=UPI003F95F679
MNRFLQSLLTLNSLIKPTNAAAAATSAFISPFIAHAFESGKFWVFFLYINIIIADWISGTSAAKKDDTYSSEYGIAAVPRTIIMLWLPFVGWLIDKVSLTVFNVNQPGYAFYAITGMLVYHTWESMTANAYRAGWRIPKKVTSFVKSEIKAKIDRAQKKKGDGGIG